MPLAFVELRTRVVDQWPRTRSTERQFIGRDTDRVTILSVYGGDAFVEITACVMVRCGDSRCSPQERSWILGQWMKWGDVVEKLQDQNSSDLVIRQYWPFWTLPSLLFIPTYS